MTNKEPCPIRITSTESGWVLPFTLVFLLSLQVISLSALSIARTSVRSATSFYELLQQTQPGRGPDTTTLTNLDFTPEGWDHACFNTVLRQRVAGRVQAYAWRVQLSAQPSQLSRDVVLNSNRPSLMILIDDSESMQWSGGRDYDARRVYLQKPDGTIIPTDQDPFAQGMRTVPEGTLFTGSYGNLHFKAPLADYSGGAMPLWTRSLEYIHTLCNELDLCEIALASTSRGIIQPFTRRTDAIPRALQGLTPHTTDSALAEATYALTGALSPSCATRRHLLLITDGYAHNDGNLPGWLQDYDGDGDAGDTHIGGIGSRCLDDVAAYTAAQGIDVHVMGPTSPFLQQVATRGSGQFIPDAASLVPQDAFVCQMRAGTDSAARYLLNTRARFDAPWMNTDACSWYRVRDNILQPAATGTIRGITTATCVVESTLYTTTSHDTLVAVDLPSGAVKWALEGVGGPIRSNGSTLIAGPDNSGKIHVLSDKPGLRWKTSAELCTAAASTLYLARGREILSFQLASGFAAGIFTPGSPASALRYDPARGCLLAGCTSGLIYILDQDLGLNAAIASDLTSPVRDIHAFDNHKSLNILAIGDNHLACLTTDGIQWSSDVAPGIITATLVAGNRIYLTTWKAAAACPGIDTGQSYLSVLDALDGHTIAHKSILAGKAFGPYIDLERKLLEYVNWKLTTHHEDISMLEGVDFVPLGTRIAAEP